MLILEGGEVGVVNYVDLLLLAIIRETPDADTTRARAI
jgi:hypothetical protein